MQFYIGVGWCFGVGVGVKETYFGVLQCRCRCRYINTPTPTPTPAILGVDMPDYNEEIIFFMLYE